MNEIYIRNSRDDLNKYPTWPSDVKMGLGQIGFYVGQKARFKWVTDLSTLGIQTPINAPVRVELGPYFSKKNVASRQYVDPNTRLLNLSYKFAKKNAFVTQGFDSEHHSLNILLLEREIQNAIAAGTLSWHPDWLIVTDIWHAEYFASMLSMGCPGKALLSANLPINDQTNIANPALGWTIENCHRVLHNGLAQPKVNAYFHVHRLTVGNTLKKYGN